MSMKEAFGEKDPELVSRQSVVQAAVAAFEHHAWGVYGSALVEETSTLTTTEQVAVDMAAMSTQNMVQMLGVDDVRAA